VVYVTLLRPDPDRQPQLLECADPLLYLFGTFLVSGVMWPAPWSLPRQEVRTCLTGRLSEECSYVPSEFYASEDFPLATRNSEFSKNGFYCTEIQDFGQYRGRRFPRRVNATVPSPDSYGTAISVIGDSIANANTVGYKPSRADFTDILAGSLAGGGVTVGSGSQVLKTTPVFSQGTLERTGQGLDLGIQGNGFFIHLSSIVACLPDRALVSKRTLLAGRRRHLDPRPVSGRWR
jgi:hypothetical protein